MGIVLLIVLTGLQGMHFAYLQYGGDGVQSAPYRMLLFAVAPAFYLFSRPLLRAQDTLRAVDLWHALPVVLAFWLPYSLALPLSFAVGAGYLFWLAYCVYALRAQRSRFQLELQLLGVVFVIAVAVMFLGLAVPLISERLFFMLYASAIGGAFLLVNLALGYAPQLSTDVTEAARETYATSTLGNVDHRAALQVLQTLMDKEHLYRQSDLDLTTLAARMDLSTHQLSELINVHLGKGFSRYIRECRVAAAQTLLLQERSASVLSVGMSVGFTSQSNFYAAFREIAGMTPGQYRQLPVSTPK